MTQKAEKTEIVTTNPLVESGVEKMIQVIRGKQVLLDGELAMLYGVETKRINEQVKRNIERFPEDFCFRLMAEEVKNVGYSVAGGRSRSQMGMRTII